MESQNIAIVGLGRKGALFLEHVLQFKYTGIHVVCALEAQDTYGRELATQAGVKLADLDEMVAMSDQIEVIFDLTEDATVRQALADKLIAIGNRNTVIAPENVTRLVLNVVKNQTHTPMFRKSKKKVSVLSGTSCCAEDSIRSS
jgi:hypothetical protein